MRWWVAVAQAAGVLIATAFATTSCGAGLEFAEALNGAWYKQCPESRITVQDRREFGASHVYELEACGETFELEEGPSFDQPVELSDDEIEALKANLVPGVQGRLLGPARNLARAWCEREVIERIYLPNGEEVPPSRRQADFRVCQRRAQNGLVALGTDARDGRSFFRMESLVLAGRLELRAPACPHRSIRQCVEL